MRKLILGLILFLFLGNFSFAEEKCEYKKITKDYNRIRAKITENDFIYFGQKLNGKNIYIENNKISKEYDGYFSYLGNGIIQNNKSNGNIILIVDGNESFEFKKIIEYIPKLKIAIIQKLNGKYVILKNNKIISKEYFNIWNIVNYGEKIAFLAKKTQISKTFIIENNKEVAEYFSIKKLNYSNNKKLVYIAQVDYGQETLIEGNKKLFISNDYDTKIFFSHNNLNNFFIKKGNIYTFIKSGKKYLKKDYKNIQTINFFPNGNGYIIVEKIDGTKSIIFNGKEYKNFDNITKVITSDDLNHFAFIGTIEKKDYVVIDGKKSAFSYKNIHSLNFSPNGNKVVFIGTKSIGKRVLVENDKEIGKYQDVHSVIYSNNNELIAEIKINGKIAILKGKKIIKLEQYKNSKYNVHLLDFKISNDSKKIVFTKRVGLKESIIQMVCNNKNSISKNTLLNSKYKKYLPKIDKLVEKTNLEKLKKINLKLEKIDLGNKKYQKFKILIEYLKAKIDLEIYERENK